MGEAQSRRVRPTDGPPVFDAEVVEELVALAGTEGGVEDMRIALRSHIATLPTSEATEWLQLFGVLGRVDSSLAPDLIRAVGLEQQSQGIAGADLIIGVVAQASDTDGAPLLALAAQLAAKEDAGRAAEIRRSFLDRYPEALEAIEVMLLQAKWLFTVQNGEEEGIRLLEELIVNAPEHPLAPEARRLYEASGARDAGSAGR